MKTAITVAPHGEAPTLALGNGITSFREQLRDPVTAGLPHLWGLCIVLQEVVPFHQRTLFSHLGNHPHAETGPRRPPGLELQVRALDAGSPGKPCMEETE